MARSALLATLFVLTAFAGCSGTTTTTTSSTSVTHAMGSYHLDCSISNWNETCLAHASPNDSPSKAEIDIVVNPADPMNVFVASKDLDRKASSCVWAVGQYTKDGGHHWNTTYVGKALSERTPADAMYGWECITDPIMQFESDGTLHYSLQAYKYRPLGADPTGMLPEGGFMFHAISHDGGATFPTIFLMHVGDETAIFHDYMRMGVNPATNTVFTIWNQLTGGATSEPVMVAVEHNAATSRPPVYFPQTASPTGLGESSIVGAKDGTVYAWLSGFNSGGLAVLATSTDDGKTFTPGQQVWTFTAMDELKGAKFRTGTSVELTIDNSDGPHKGCLYAVWGGKETAVVGPSDVYVRTSCDKGVTWTNPALVNTQHREDGQWMARASVDGQGTVHVVYLTRAYDPAHQLADAEHAYSTDGGKNWTQERLTTLSFDGDLGIHQNGFPFIGDYIGISSTGADTYMGFPTTFTGRAEIAVAHSVAEAAPAHMH